jgi:hypothetical protein
LVVRTAVRVVSPPNTSVYPSAGAAAAAWVAILPPAPALFSITIEPPRFLLASVLINRAATSVTPPGANGTMSLMGLLGKAFCAAHGAAAASASGKTSDEAMTAAPRRRNRNATIISSRGDYPYTCACAITAMPTTKKATGPGRPRNK